MALDTASKRGSSLNFFNEFMDVTFPFPDGTIDAGDRQHALGCYSGILADAPVAVSGVLVRYRRPPWRVKGIFK